MRLLYISPLVGCHLPRRPGDYRFLMNETGPAVVALQVHLPGHNTVTFRHNALLCNVISYPNAKKIMLTEYFTKNREDPFARTLFYREFPEKFVWHADGKVWNTRQRGFVVGRVVSAAPSEEERYFLRLLLGTVKGATSFEHLKFVNGTQHPTFKDAALALGLLEPENSIELSLAEACLFQMPRSLRRLFAVILVYCNPPNARALWVQFESHLIEDYISLGHASVAAARSTAYDDVSWHLHSMGKRIQNYDLPCSSVNSGRLGTLRELTDELSMISPQANIDYVHHLNVVQRVAFDDIFAHVVEKRDGCFFIDGPGGTGKTYLYRCLLAAVRSKGWVALATASSGVAASILPGGRTAHSRFKIPLNIDDNTTCNVGKQSSLAGLLREARLIVWDEAPMVRKQAIEALNVMLQDVCSSSLLFGGKVIVLGGDFRQVLPIIPRATVEHTVDSCLLRSHLWPKLKKYRLRHNMRAQLDPPFSEFLLSVGNDKEPKHNIDDIQLPSEIVIDNQTLNALQVLIEKTYLGISLPTFSVDTLGDRALLTPKNTVVNELNSMLIEKFSGEEVVYRSFDAPGDSSTNHFQEDFCNSLTPSGFPPHMLRLKRDCPVMLLRNLDPSRGMCNGTRLICKEFGRNLISAEVLCGEFKGNKILLPRIPMLPLESDEVPFPFKRTQFPINLCFAMTINKAQGQTLDFVGIYLPQPVFSHGQLYVALSRARSSRSVRVLVDSSNLSLSNSTCTRNVVNPAVLALAGH